MPTLYSPNTLATNAEKRSKPPSEYFNERLKEHGDAKLKGILKSHLIPDDALESLLKENLGGFLEKKKGSYCECGERKSSNRGMMTMRTDKNRGGC